MHPIFAVQQEWSLFTRNLEDELVPTCVELGVAILVAYSPLARNLLTLPEPLREGDWRLMNLRFSSENFAKILTLVT